MHACRNVTMIRASRNVITYGFRDNDLAWGWLARCRLLFPNLVLDGYAVNQDLVAFG